MRIGILAQIAIGLFRCLLNMANTLEGIRASVIASIDNGSHDRHGVRFFWFELRKRPKRHEAMQRAVAGRETSRDNERPNMAAVLEGLPRAPRLDDERATSGRVCSSGSDSNCTRSGRASNRLPQNRKSMRRRIRGEQGRNPGLRPGQARVHRHMPHRQRNPPPRRCSRARSGPWADRLAVPMATDGRAHPSAWSFKL